MERIQSTAIRFFLDHLVYVVKGSSYTACINTANKEYYEFKDRNRSLDDYGFVTNTNRFVKGEEAYMIAKKANQLKYDNNILEVDNLIF